MAEVVLRLWVVKVREKVGYCECVFSNKIVQGTGKGDRKMITTVIFDMDGVLIDSEPVYLEAMLEFGQHKRPELLEKDICAIVGRTSQDSWEIMEKAIGNGQNWQELRHDYREWIDVSQGLDYTRIFREEARGLLEELKQRGYRIALASSTHRQLVLHVLFQNQILQYFERIITGDQFKKSKPDPEIYHYTAKAMGVKEEECFVLEDSTVGIQAAHDAGMTVAALIDDRFGFDRKLADYEVESVDKILDYLPEKNR